MGFAILSHDEIKMCHVCCGYRSGTCPDGPSESFLAASYSVYVPISITDTSQVLISLFITECPADLESILNQCKWQPTIVIMPFQLAEYQNEQLLLMFSNYRYTTSFPFFREIAFDYTEQTAF